MNIILWAICVVSLYAVVGMTAITLVTRYML